MIVDLHAHYPMHLLAEDAEARMLRFRRPQWMNWFKVLVLKLANRVKNYERGEPTVTIENLRAGHVGVALSMLDSPFAEFDLSQPYGAPPSPGYINDLRDEIQMVEWYIDHAHPAEAAVAHNLSELEAALAQGKVALIHAVEGGFQVGHTPEAVRAHVRELAHRGVAYITVAHLFWRHVATNAPALTIMPDWLYRWLFPQPREPLTKLGRVMMQTMVEEHVLIDVTHMSNAATDATFALLDEIDPEREVPLFAGHAACRFGSLEYNLSDRHIDAIARRRGVLGLISGSHYLADGVRDKPRNFDESMELVFRHVDHIREVTGSHAYTAFGSDLDGFDKPALPGLETPAAFARIEDRLTQKYGAAVAQQICSGNALRMLRYWGH